MNIYSNIYSYSHSAWMSTFEDMFCWYFPFTEYCLSEWLLGPTSDREGDQN